MFEEKNSVAASSTVFLSLILLLIASLLFTLLEGARISGLRANGRMDGELVTESLMAEYCTPLMERYRLFLLDGSYGSGDLDKTALQRRATDLMDENLSENGIFSGNSYDMYHMQMTDCELMGYQLATDGNGEAFYTLVTDYMKHNLALEAAELLYQKVQQAKETKTSAGDLDEKRKSAADSLQKAKEEKKRTEDKGQTEDKKQTEDKVKVNETSSKGSIRGEESEIKEDSAQTTQEEVKNPIEYVTEWKNQGILTLLGADEQSISKLTIDRTNCLENREKAIGTIALTGSGDWYERILFQEYLMKYFGSYTAPKEGCALEYELEYLIAGGATDKDNLVEVATRLLGIREAANFILIQTDRDKCAEAMTLATLIIGYSCNPIFVKALQEGILAAWAFAESVSDVKSLLNGERIPILKSSADWSTDVVHMQKNQAFDSAKKCENGLDYADYLRILLYLENKNTQSLRAMDLIEQNLRLVEGYANLKMDAMVDKVIVDYSYQAKPLFLSFVTIGNFVQSPYKWRVSTQNTYLQKK